MSNPSKHLVWVIPVITLLFLHQMVFFGKDPLANDVVAHYPIGQWGDEYVKKNGELPQWYPHLFGGMPAYSGYAYTPSDPLSNLMSLFDLGRAYRYWFYFSVGGIGMFFFLRRRTLGVLPSVFGATLFALTPYMFGLINAGHSSKIYALSFLPYVILAADHVLSKSSWRGMLYLGLATGLQLWTKHPQVVYYTWMMVVFLWLWHQASAFKKGSWSLRKEGFLTGMLVGSLLLVALLASDPYASIYQFQKQSNRGAPSVLDKTGDTEKGTSWDYATQWSFHPKETVSFVFPYFYGLQNYPTRDLKSQSYWGYMPFTQSTHYLGLLSILIVILGFTVRKPDQFTISMIVASCLILLIGFGEHFPVLFWPLFKFAPMFSKFRIPSMIYVLLPFTVGVLASIGLDNILTALKSGESQLLTKIRKWSLALFGIIIFVSLVLLIMGDSVAQSIGLFMKTGETSRFQPNVLSQLKEIRLEVFQTGMLLALFISGAGLVAIWLGIKRIFKPLIVGLFLITISTIDLWVVDQEFLHLKPARNIRAQFRATPVVKFLEQDNSLFRILPIDDFGSNWYGYFGLSSVGGYRPVKLRLYQDLLDAGGLNSQAILNMLNVKYLITKRDIQSPNYNLVFRDGQNVYENLSVLPKAWFISEIQSLSTQEQSLRAVLSPDFDPSKTAIVLNYDGPDLGNMGSGNVSVEKYDENEIVLRAKSDAGGLIVLSENYYGPGWKATIDGTPTKVYQTNHILRSVYVGSGEHTINFTYDTTVFRVSRTLSRISLVAIILTIIFLNRESVIGLLSRFRRGE